MLALKPCCPQRYNLGQSVLHKADSYRCNRAALNCQRRKILLGDRPPIHQRVGEALRSNIAPQSLLSLALRFGAIRSPRSE